MDDLVWKTTFEILISRNSVRTARRTVSNRQADFIKEMLEEEFTAVVDAEVFGA